MSHFLYRAGVLHAEDVPVPAIIAETDSPVYIYSATSFRQRYRAFALGLTGLDHLVCYAVKANSNQAILRLLADQGAGFDVVSGGEYARVRAAGARGDAIVFSGVGKTGTELRQALSGGVRHVNVESEPELELLNDVAAGLGCVAPASLRVNPDVDAATHEKISTGRAGDKFGIPLARVPAVFAHAQSLTHVEMHGIAVHIGSQITSLEPFAAAWQKIAALAGELRASGLPVTRLDLGGGLGVAYRPGEPVPAISDFCDLIKRLFGASDFTIEIEPGRNIAAESGILVASVILEKTIPQTRLLVLDAGMNDFARPSLYDAHHTVMPVIAKEADLPNQTVDIVGPVCESADRFGRRRPLPPLDPGDLVAFSMAGAYGAVMASEYNSRPLVAEALVDGDQLCVIRPRATIDTMIARDIIPPWM